MAATTYQRGITQPENTPAGLRYIAEFYVAAGDIATYYTDLGRGQDISVLLGLTEGTAFLLDKKRTAAGANYIVELIGYCVGYRIG